MTTYTAIALGSAGEYTTLTYAVDAGAATPIVNVGRSAPADENIATGLSAVSRSEATVRLYNTGETVITIDVAPENGSIKERYTITVSRSSELSSDATLQALTLSGVTLSPEFNSATTAYTAEVEDIETTTVEATVTHPGATVAGTGEKTLRVGDNVISVMVTAEDGTTTMTYTVTVTVLDEDGMVTPGDDLLDRYDADDSGHIDITEVNEAINDYFDGDITLTDVNTVINLYFL